MKALLVHIVLILCFVWLTVFSHRGLVALNQSMRIHAGAAEQLYLPNGDGLHFLSLGYKNALADVLWFNTINYFGEHYASDHNYKWLAHMCNLVTTLDPLAVHVYEFAALMLAWEAKNVEQSNAILTKAIHTPVLRDHPLLWKFYYLRGFNNSFFLDQGQLAARDFAIGAKLPNAHVILARLAAKKLSTAANDPDSAIEFLRDMLRTTSDAYARRALIDRLNEILEQREKRHAQ